MTTEKSYTRVTLSLDIIKKIPQGVYQGYHELGIIKHQIDLFDVVSISPASKMSISCNDSNVPLDSRNICWKAFDLIKREYGFSQSVSINIQKNIPVMGGLAGGSANAATTLNILNKLGCFNLSNDQLAQLGRKLGMDVPYYFYGGTAFDTETTGVLEPIASSLKFYFVLAVPDFGISTINAYGAINYDNIGRLVNQTSMLREGLQKDDRMQVIDNMHNDFEFSVFVNFPRLEQLKKRMLELGCLNVVLSGSGSTLLGLVSDYGHAKKIEDQLDCKLILAKSL